MTTSRINELEKLIIHQKERSYLITNGPSITSFVHVRGREMIHYIERLAKLTEYELNEWFKERVPLLLRVPNKEDSHFITQ